MDDLLESLGGCLALLCMVALQIGLALIPLCLGIWMLRWMGCV